MSSKNELSPLLIMVGVPVFIVCLGAGIISLLVYIGDHPLRWHEDVERCEAAGGHWTEDTHSFYFCAQEKHP